MALSLVGVGFAWFFARRTGPLRIETLGRFAVPVLLFLATFLFGMAVSVRKGAPPTDLVYNSLPVMAFLSYFLFRAAYAGRSHVLARDMILVTAIFGVVASIATLVGFAPLAGSQINFVITGDAVSEAKRLDAPLLRLMSLTILMLGVGSIMRHGRWRHLRFPLLLAMVFTEAMSLTRSTWAPLILGAIALPALWSCRPARTLVLRVLAALLIAVAGVSVASTGALGAQGKTIADRLLSTTNTETTKEGSLKLREEEIDKALAQVEQHPVTGVGFFQPYGVYWKTFDNDLETTTYTPQQFIHQSYLGVWIWLGLPGVAALAYLFWSVVRAGWSVWRTRDADRSTPIACLGGLFCLALSSSFQTNIIYAPAYVAAAGGLAYVDLWLTERRAKHVTPPVPRLNRTLTRSL